MSLVNSPKPWPERESFSDWGLADYRAEIKPLGESMSSDLLAVEATATDNDVLASAYAGISWAHHMSILDGLPSNQERRWRSRIAGIDWNTVSYGLWLGYSAMGGYTPYSYRMFKPTQTQPKNPQENN